MVAAGARGVPVVINGAAAQLPKWSLIGVWQRTGAWEPNDWFEQAFGPGSCNQPGPKSFSACGGMAPPFGPGWLHEPGPNACSNQSFGSRAPVRCHTPIKLTL